MGDPMGVFKLEAHERRLVVATVLADAEDVTAASKPPPKPKSDGFSIPGLDHFRVD